MVCAGAGGREAGHGLLHMSSLQSTLHTRLPAQSPTAQPAQTAQPALARSPSLDTWGGPSASAPRAVDAQALSGFHSGSWVRCQPPHAPMCFGANAVTEQCSLSSERLASLQLSCTCDMRKSGRSDSA